MSVIWNGRIAWAVGNLTFSAAMHLYKATNSFCCIEFDNTTKKCNISCADKQTSLNNSSKAFANQHTVAPVKTCRLFPLFEWTPAGTFDAVLASCAFIQWKTSHTCLVYKKCKSHFICQSQASSENSVHSVFKPIFQSMLICTAVSELSYPPGTFWPWKRSCNYRSYTFL